MAKTANERQIKCRKKKKARLEKNGGRVITMEVYEKTDQSIINCCSEGGFDDVKEMLTILFKNIDKLSAKERAKLLSI